MTDSALTPQPGLPIGTVGVGGRVAARGVVEPVDLLPEAARRKYEGLQDAKDSAHAAMMQATDRHRQAHTELLNAQLMLARYEEVTAAANDRRGPLPNRRPPLIPTWKQAIDRSARTDARVKALTEDEMIIERRVVEKLQRNADRLKAEVDRLTSEWSALARVEAPLREYVEGRLIGVKIAAADTVEAKVGKGESPRDAVARVRAEIAGLRDEVRAVKKAPYPSAEVKARVAATVDALAEMGAPRVQRAVRHAGPPEFPEMHVETRMWMEGKPFVGRATVPDTTALLAWMFPDAMKAALEREVQRVADDAQAIPAAERPTKLKALAGSILAAERQEEAIIMLADERGDTIHRREDADPRAILGLADGMPGPAE